ncbi:MAG: tetratricopeptide repeat protein [Gemmataceae bacterium]|nr:tetratricopeptide repeat protein [Gemmataceae bacterium]MDW8264238.1 tetratricopeptide repeat protein [Gemmataceae bacterium]
MSTTLNLASCLLNLGRNYHELGRLVDALRVLSSLVRLRELPTEVAEEAHRRLGLIQLRRRRFRRARRHLAVALTYRPDCGEYHYWMAQALQGGAGAEPARALEHYRRALALEPTQASWWADYGMLAVQEGEAETGLQAVRHAVELAPDDPAIARRLAEALCLAEQPEEARRALRQAMFRNSGDRRFRQVYDEFRYQQTRRQQLRCRRRSRRSEEDNGPVLLPFAPPEGGAARVFRQDAGGGLPRPHPPRHAGQSRRHA